MIKVPAFLLRRLYVKGSLKNTANGFEFQLKNTLGSGYASKLLPLTIDGAEIASDKASFSADGKLVPFFAATKETPFTLSMNKVSTISVNGAKLESGVHKIVMGFVVVGLGELSFDVTDTLAQN